MRPHQAPIGLVLTRTARQVGRAFDAALADAGGSLPIWLILLALKTRSLSSQRDLAEAVGITQATLTHHLAILDRDKLITRQRCADNHRAQVVTLTQAGDAAFARLRQAAMDFDSRLRMNLTDAEAARLRELLDRLAALPDAPRAPAERMPPPWAGAALASRDAADGQNPDAPGDQNRKAGA